MTSTTDPSDQAVLDALDDAWTQLRELGTGLGEAEWRRPTECPGWSVQDQYAHLAGFERQLLGEAPPDHEPVLGTHVRNVIGEINERWVDWYRARPGVEVFEDFERVTAQRLEVLRAATPDDLAQDSWTPVGPGTVRDLLPFRVFDAWVHSQDVRRALGRPGGFDGPAAEASMARVVGSLPYVVGKKVAPPDGTVVSVTVTDAPRFDTAVRVVNGRAVAESAARMASVTIALDADSLVRLSTGRGDPFVITAGRVQFDGDVELGRRVVEAMNVVF